MEGRRLTLIASLAILACFAITWGIQGAILVNLGAIESDGGQADEVYITVSGSTTCFPVIEEAANIYMDNHSNYEIRVSAGGSSTGVKNAGERISDIGMASRDIKSSENESYNYELIDYVFAADGIAIIFDADNIHGVTNLTIEQIFLIYNGTYDSWDDGDLGGAPIAIDVVTRAEGSGTRSSFEELITYGGEELGDDSGYISNVGGYTTYADNPAVAAYVADHPNSIGYVGLAFIDDAEHLAVPVSDNGVDYYDPTVANVQSGDYPVSRNLHLVTRGLPNAGTQAFIDFIYGPIGQAIVADVGYVPLY
jgi:phosphate transport system substrate-binding protein